MNVKKIVVLACCIVGGAMPAVSGGYKAIMPLWQVQMIIT